MNTEKARFEVTDHVELADRGALLIGYIRDGILKIGMVATTTLLPKDLTVSGMEFMDDIRGKRSWNALVFAEKPTLDVLKTTFPMGSVVELRPPSPENLKLELPCPTTT